MLEFVELFVQLIHISTVPQLVFLPQSMPVALHCCLNHWQYSLFLNDGRDLIRFPLNDLAQNMPQDLVAAGLRKPIDNQHMVEAGDWSHFLPHQSHQLPLNALPTAARLDDHESDGYFSLEFLHLANYCCFYHCRMGDEHFLHGRSGEAVAGCVDHIIHPRAYIEVSIFIEVSRIASGVVAGSLTHVLLEEGLVVVVQRTHEGGGHRKTHADLAWIKVELPRVLGGTGSFQWFMIYTMNPGTGLVVDPGLDGKVCSLWQLVEMSHPTSVCPQQSLTSTSSLERIHSQVWMSHLSPATDTPRREEVSYFLTQSPPSSSFRMARRAVGLVYTPFTRCLQMMAHIAPGLGRVGFPSQRTVAAPTSSGPQMLKMWLTTHPMSLAAKQTSFMPIPMMCRIVHRRATAVLPWSRTIPLGVPVVPEVQRMQRQSVLCITSAGSSSKGRLSMSNSSQAALHDTSKPGLCRMSTCGVFPAICSASVRISTQLTFLLGSKPQLAVTTTVGSQSVILLASSLAANPPKTMECTAPIRAHAHAANCAQGIMGMQMMTRSPLRTPLALRRWPMRHMDSQAWRRVQMRSELTMLETQMRACLWAWRGRKRSKRLWVMLMRPSGNHRAKAGSLQSRMVLGKQNHSTSLACSSQYPSLNSEEAARRQASQQAFSIINKQKQGIQQIKQISLIQNVNGKGQLYLVWLYFVFSLVFTVKATIFEIS